MTTRKRGRQPLFHSFARTSVAQMQGSELGHGEGRDDGCDPVLVLFRREFRDAQHLFRAQTDGLGHPWHVDLDNRGRPGSLFTTLWRLRWRRLVLLRCSHVGSRLCQRGIAPEFRPPPGGTPSSKVVRREDGVALGVWSVRGDGTYFCISIGRVPHVTPGCTPNLSRSFLQRFCTICSTLGAAAPSASTPADASAALNAAVAPRAGNSCGGGGSGGGGGGSSSCDGVVSGTLCRACCVCWGGSSVFSVSLLLPPPLFLILLAPGGDSSGNGVKELQFKTSQWCCTLTDARTSDTLSNKWNLRFNVLHTSAAVAPGGNVDA